MYFNVPLLPFAFWRLNASKNNADVTNSIFKVGQVNFVIILAHVYYHKVVIVIVPPRQ